MEVNPSFEFDHWEVNNNVIIPSDTSLAITINLAAGDDIVAVFIPRLLTDSLVINEINYHSAADFDPGDWIEFYNPQPYSLNLTNWKFRDENDLHEYTFPAGTTIPSHGYLVLTEVPASFDSLFPAVVNDMGPMGFGFSGNGELLRLYNNLGMMVDTVHYDDALPWPTEPDGNGPTLELINPGRDNALPQNWAGSCSTHGTPGVQNCVFVSVSQIAAGNGPVTFSVWPNPFHITTKITVNTESEIRDGTLTVFNLLGKEVMRQEHLSAKQITLQRGSLQAGSYYFRFTSNGASLVGSGKLIID